MSEPLNNDPRVDQAKASDLGVLDAHEKLLGRHPDDGARYKLLPIAILFTLSGLILFAGTYLNRYTAHYSGVVYNENQKPSSGAPVAVKIDPIAQGTGIAGIYPPLAGSEWVNGPSSRVIRIVLYGLKGKVTVAGKDFGAAAMPVFGQVAGSAYNWSDEKVAAVLTYVRQEWGNKAGAVTADEVSAVRKSLGDRKEFSEAELQDVK